MSHMPPFRGIWSSSHHEEQLKGGTSIKGRLKDIFLSGAKILSGPEI